MDDAAGVARRDIRSRYRRKALELILPATLAGVLAVPRFSEAAAQHAGWAIALVAVSSATMIIKDVHDIFKSRRHVDSAVALLEQRLDVTRHVAANLQQFIKGQLRILVDALASTDEWDDHAVDRYEKTAVDAISYGYGDGTSSLGVRSAIYTVIDYDGALAPSKSRNGWDAQRLYGIPRNSAAGLEVALLDEEGPLCLP